MNSSEGTSAHGEHFLIDAKLRKSSCSDDKSDIKITAVQSFHNTTYRDILTTLNGMKNTFSWIRNQLFLIHSIVHSEQFMIGAKLNLKVMLINQTE